ncbi:MAG: cyclic pyranopterin monophosphate synthase MoaC [Kiritimatiellia bacterium]|jgi:cyclic pyranopterin phosphate synthase|nr:cyclic pyranopterin monophosphate synthase MoaC [Kiritimatiellia bacterium]
MGDNTEFSHVSDDDTARMVDVSSKDPTTRSARAQAVVRLGDRIAGMLRDTGSVSKGPVLETARIAGIMASKRTSGLIPMCHPLPLDVVNVDFELKDTFVVITSEARCHAVTGVEMEALTAVSIAALTVYDMCKSAEKGITIESIRLLEKSGGKSGHWKAEQA